MVNDDMKVWVDTSQEELFYGLTVWGDDFSAQIRDYADDTYLMLHIKEHAYHDTDGTRGIKSADVHLLLRLLMAAHIRGEFGGDQ